MNWLRRASLWISIAMIVTAVALMLRPRTRVPALPPPPPPLTAAEIAERAVPLPTDPTVTVGTFENGFRYYLRTNATPLKRAELRLVVNVGSVVEDDDQRGLAHFVEHMAFNGTRHFPKQDIVTFLQSLGMRFGPSVNASTTFDQTVYSVQVPTERPEVLDRALLILEDWAHGVSFDAAEIEKERGVIIEEWRQRRGAMARVQDAQLPLLLQGSRYAERIPIGTTDSLRTFRPERLRQFYADWYRPDLMALVAVGDFTPASLEALARKHFASLPMPARPRPRPSFAVPPQPGTRYLVVKDPEAPGAFVSLSKTAPAPGQQTIGDYRRQIIERLASSMLGARLSAAAQTPEAPFLAASVSRALLVQTVEASALSASVREDQIMRGVAGLLLEVERLTQFGFTQEELDQQKAIALRRLEQAATEQTNRSSASIAAEYVRAYTEHEPFPGIAAEVAITNRVMPGITLAEANVIGTSWFADGDRLMMVSAPEKSGVTVPTDADLATVVRAAASARVTPYVLKTSTQPLMEARPKPGTIAQVTTRPDMGITEWQLSNGMRVVLKPTSFKEDEILFRASSPGGTSLASDADYVPAATAAQVVGATGVGKFASGDLRTLLVGKAVNVQPIIGPIDVGLAGGASRKDLETLFQLVHLYFTQPRRDPAIFSAMTSQMKSSLANQASTPDFAFQAALSSALTQNHPRARPMTPQAVDAMDLDKSLAFYKDRFADASGFTFVFVGSLDPVALRPLVETYLASLPSLHRQETWKDVGLRPPAGIVQKRVAAGVEPRSRAAIYFQGPFTWEPTRAVALQAMAEVLQDRLRETLREELSGTYTVSASASASKFPIAEFSVAVTFGSDPARTDALVTRVFEVIAKYRAGGPTPAEVAQIKATLARDYESASRQNAFLLGQLVQRYQSGETPESMLQLPDIFRGLTAAAIQDAARTALDPQRYVKVTLFPAK